MVKAHVKREDFNIFLRDYNCGGSTLLHVACRFSHLEIAKYLVDRVFNVWGKEQLHAFLNCIDSSISQMTPLIELSRSTNGLTKDRSAIAEVLINRGASLHLADINGDTPLHWAVRYVPFRCLTLYFSA